MADFTFAIVVPLASPIRPVATPEFDVGTWGVQDFKMVPVEAAVNSSIERLSRLVWRVSCAIRRASVSTNRLVMQRNKRCVQMHNSPKRALLLPSCHRAKVTGPVATGVVRQSSFSLNLVCRARSRFSRMRLIARNLKARRFP